MVTEKSPETNVFDIDWTTIDDDDKVEILLEHVKFVDLSRSNARIIGAANSTIRGLLLTMLLALIMGFNEFDNKTIVISIISLQFIRAILSKLVQAGMRYKIEEAKKELARFMARKLGSRAKG